MELDTTAVTPSPEKPTPEVGFLSSYFNDANAEATLTVEDIAKLSENNMGVGEAVTTAASQEWIHNAPALWLESMDDEAGFSITKDMEAADGIAAMVSTDRDFIREATSTREYNYRKEVIRKRNEAGTRLAGSGFSAKAAYVATSVLDVEEIAAVSALTLGAGGVWRLATAPARAMQMARGMTATAQGARALVASRTAASKTTTALMLENLAVAAPFELARAEYDPTYSITDAAAMLAVITPISTGLGKLAQHGDKMRLAAVYERRLLARDDAGELIPLSKDELEFFDPIIGRDIIDDIERKLNPEAAKATKGSKAANTANTIDSSNPELYADAPYQLGYSIISGGLGKRLSAVRQGMSSPIGLIRKMSGSLGTNFSGNTDRSAVNFSALDFSSYYQDRMFARTLPRHQQLRHEYISSVLPSGGRRIKNVIQYERDKMTFNRQVSRYIRYGGVNVDPRVKESAELFRKELDELFNEALTHKVVGLSKDSMKPNYLPRIYDDSKIDAFLVKNGAGAFKAKIFNSLIKGQPDLDQKLAKQISDGYSEGLIKRLRNRALETPDRKPPALMEDTLDDIIDLMRKSGTMSSEDIALAERELQKIFDKGQAGQKGISRARRRLDMDETELDEFLSDDIEELMNGYSFQMGGSIGLARNGIDVEGGKTFQAMLDDITKYNLDNKILREEDLKKQIASLEFMYDSVRGQVIKQGEPMEKFFRRMRDGNFVRVMNATGITSLIETANVLTEHSMLTVIKSVPKIRSLVKKMKNGDLDNDLGREILHATGTGIDMFTGRVKAHFDDVETGFVDKDYAPFDHALAKGRQITATISGMLPVTAILRRLDGYMYATDWIDAAQKYAKNGKVKSPYAKIKMEQLGVPQEDISKIFDMINKYAIKDNKGKVTSLNGESWKATEEGTRLFETLMLSARRNVLTNVQETSAGSVNRVLRSSLGKTLFQFMSYPIAAAEQQAQRLAVRAGHGDAASVGKVILAQGMASTLVYLGVVHQRALGMSDEKRKKYLEEAMKPSSIAWGAASYLGSLGVLPMFVGQVSSNKLFQAPIFDIINTFTKVFNNTKAAAFEGKEWSEGDWRSAGRLLPFQNWYISNYILNGVSDKLSN